MGKKCELTHPCAIMSIDHWLLGIQMNSYAKNTSGYGENLSCVNSRLLEGWLV